jgi:hypothetical protein
MTYDGSACKLLVSRCTAASKIACQQWALTETYLVAAVVDEDVVRLDVSMEHIVLLQVPVGQGQIQPNQVLTTQRALVLIV